jgi:hypothetical protein
MGNHNSEHKMNEVLTLDEQRIVQLLSGLDRVNSPTDFNFRVKARIAAAPSSTRRSWMPAVLKLAFPVILLMLILGVFLMRDPGVSMSDQVAKADEVQLVPGVVSQEPAASLPQSVSVAPGEVPNPPKIEQKESIAVVKRSPEPATPKAAVVKEVETSAPSGSIDLSSNVTQGINVPVPVNANKTFSPPKGSGRPVRLSATGVFSLMGIKGSFSGSEFKVMGITAGSAAEQSGIKAGDIVEAINGQPLAGGLTFPHDFAGGSLKVRRNGQVVVLNVGQ